MASSGLGALIAVVVIVPLAQARKRGGIVMLTALFWLAFWLTILAQSRVVGLSMAALFLANLAVTTVLTMSMGLVQVMSPVDMRGRLMSLFVTIGVGAQPIAALWIGQLAQMMGVDTSIQFNAILLAVGAVLMLVFRPAILRYEYGQATSVQPAMKVAGVEGGGDVVPLFVPLMLPLHSLLVHLRAIIQV